MYRSLFVPSDCDWLSERAPRVETLVVLKDAFVSTEARWLSARGGRGEVRTLCLDEEEDDCR